MRKPNGATKWNGASLSEARLDMGLTRREFAFELSRVAGYLIEAGQLAKWESGIQPGASSFATIVTVSGRPMESFFTEAVRESTLAH